MTRFNQSELDLDDPEPNYDFETPQEREKRAEKIAFLMGRLGKIFFCEACGNIHNVGNITDQTGLCLICHGYRFNRDEADIAAHLQRLGSRPRNSVLPADYI